MGAQHTHSWAAGPCAASMALRQQPFHATSRQGMAAPTACCCAACAGHWTSAAGCVWRRRARPTPCCRPAVLLDIALRLKAALHPQPHTPVSIPADTAVVAALVHAAGALDASGPQSGVAGAELYTLPPAPVQHWSWPQRLPGACQPRRPLLATRCARRVELSTKRKVRLHPP